MASESGRHPRPCDAHFAEAFDLQNVRSLKLHQIMVACSLDDAERAGDSTPWAALESESVPELRACVAGLTQALQEAEQQLRQQRQQNHHHHQQQQQSAALEARGGAHSNLSRL